MTPKARRWIVLLAAVAMAALTARLGVWQLDRAAQKTALQQGMEQRRLLPALALKELPPDEAGALVQRHRQVQLQGRWSSRDTVFLENRQMDARPGFFAFTPLMLDDGSAVLVQRGWFPRDLIDRTRIVAPAPPTGRVDVQGRIAPRPGRVYEFAGAGSGPIRQNLDLSDYARETSLPLRPFILVQEDGPVVSADGLLRRWPAPAADVHKHYGYAFQWFALSVLVTCLYVWFQLIRPLRQKSR